MTPLEYLPFPQIKEQAAVVVDSFHPNGLVLSHWREAPTPEPLREDTSAGIVLQAIKQNWPDLDRYAYVTANHFDIDALVGVWALMHPQEALAHEQTLRQVASIGDFREVDWSDPFAEKALQIVCWINTEEKARFYPPFGTEELEENEVTASIPKFLYFLGEFKEMLCNTELFEYAWKEEFALVKEGRVQMQKEQSKIVQYPKLGLFVIETPQPVHYYALFGSTKRYDLVLSCYSGNRYELESKYTTWVDLESRPTLPRLDLRPLAHSLNTIERSGWHWAADGVTDTGPLLYLQGVPLTKVQRYGNPTDRPIFSSSIEPEDFQQIVVNYLKNSFLGVLPKKIWTWEEVKRFNKNNSKI